MKLVILSFLNDTQSEAVFEIIVIILLALILGLILGWLLFRKKGNSKAFEERIIKEQKEQDKLIADLQNNVCECKCSERIPALEGEDAKIWAALKALQTAEPKIKSKPVVDVNDKELMQLKSVAERKHLINFSSIGTATEADKDDLKLVKGIGPFIEKKLNALDIWTFSQIAAFKEEDVQNVTDAIEFFPGRITRDNWVSQAVELAKK